MFDYSVFHPVWGGTMFTSSLCGAFDLQRWAWRWWWMRWRRHKSGFCAHTCVFPVVLGSLQKDSEPNIRILGGKNIKSQLLALTVDVHVTLRAVEVVLLCHDDVLDVFHGQVVAESIVEQPLQLIHCQFLHVALRRRQINNRKRWAEDGSWSSPSLAQRSGMEGADDSCNTYGTFQKTESKSAPWNLSGIPAELSLGPSNVTNSSKPTWPSPAEEWQKGHEGAPHDPESRLRVRAYRLYPVFGWWPPAPPRWACTPASAWPSPAPALRWTRYHPGQTPWTLHGSLWEKNAVLMQLGSFHILICFWGECEHLDFCFSSGH